MNNKLFGAVVATNLININEGNFADTARAVNKKLPSVVHGVGSFGRYVGNQIEKAGSGINKFGKDPKTKSKYGEVKGTWNNISQTLKKASDASGGAARKIVRGTGTVIKKAGEGIDYVGKQLVKGGRRWNFSRKLSVINKKEADEKQQQKEHDKTLKDLEKKKEVSEKQVETDLIPDKVKYKFGLKKSVDEAETQAKIKDINNPTPTPPKSKFSLKLAPNP